MPMTSVMILTNALYQKPGSIHAVPIRIVKIMTVLIRAHVRPALLVMLLELKVVEILTNALTILLNVMITGNV